MFERVDKLISKSVRGNYYVIRRLCYEQVYTNSPQLDLSL